VTLTDDNQTIICKLWNDNAWREIELGQNLLITNLFTDSFHDNVSLNSTDMTEIKVRLNINTCTIS